jgi:hypothetical protein
MAQIQPLNIPDELYHQLELLASTRNRPLEAEIVYLLEKGIQQETIRQRQSQVLRKVKQNLWKPDKPVPDSVTLLREVRGYDD